MESLLSMDIFFPEAIPKLVKNTKRISGIDVTTEIALEPSNTLITNRTEIVNMSKYLTYFNFSEYKKYQNLLI
mgnify:FL=1